jgi:hypothetical protein
MVFICMFMYTTHVYVLYIYNRMYMYSYPYLYMEETNQEDSTEKICGYTMHSMFYYYMKYINSYSYEDF